MNQTHYHILCRHNSAFKHFTLSLLHHGANSFAYKMQQTKEFILTTGKYLMIPYMVCTLYGVLSCVLILYSITVVKSSGAVIY